MGGRCVCVCVPAASLTAPPPLAACCPAAAAAAAAVFTSQSAARPAGRSMCKRRAGARVSGGPAARAKEEPRTAWDAGKEAMMA